MAESRCPLAVLGPTGYTGRLVCTYAREVGLPLRLVGRHRDALEKMTEPGEEVTLADARNEEALCRAFEGAFAVVSLAGPFLPIGLAPVRAAIRAGAHYVDSSGEQAFARLVYEQLDSEARERGVVLLTSFGFDYVPGDLAAALAAKGLEPLEELAVAYSVAGAASSRGTRRTIGHVLAQPVVAFEGGRLVPSAFGVTSRRFRFPFGEARCVEWSGTEPLTVPRHVRVASVRSYVRAPSLGPALKPLLRVAAPLFRLSARVGPRGPSEKRRRRSRFSVVAEARGRSGGRSVALTGTDPYGLTALLLVRATEALEMGVPPAAGARAPAELFDAATFAELLSPLLRIEPAQEL